MRLKARIITGLILMSAVATGSYWFAKFTPTVESTFHRRSLQLAEELIAKGDTNRVWQAIQTYNHVATTDSTYRASMAMWRALNH